MKQILARVVVSASSFRRRIVVVSAFVPAVEGGLKQLISGVI
jgi:hypothetical protein